MPFLVSAASFPLNGTQQNWKWPAGDEQDFSEADRQSAVSPGHIKWWQDWCHDLNCITLTLVSMDWRWSIQCLSMMAFFKGFTYNKCRNLYSSEKKISLLWCHKGRWYLLASEWPQPRPGDHSALRDLLPDTLFFVCLFVCRTRSKTLRISIERVCHPECHHTHQWFKNTLRQQLALADWNKQQSRSSLSMEVSSIETLVQRGSVDLMRSQI